MISKGKSLLVLRPDFLRKAAFSFSMRFIGLSVQFLGAIFIARLLGAEGFGAFTYATTWAVFVGMLIPLGLGELSIRELPSYLTNNDHHPIIGFFVTQIMTIAVVGIAATTFFWVMEALGIMTLATGWQLVSLYAVLHAAVLTTSHALNGFQKILTSQFLETILRQFFYLSIIIWIFFTDLLFTPQLVIGAAMAAAVPTLGIMLIVLMRAWREHGIKRVPPEFRTRLWFAGALPIFMTAFANRLQLDMDVLMVGGLLGNYEVGVYRAAARGAMLISIANMIALQLVGPMLSRALAQKDMDKAQSLLRQAALVSFAVGVPLCLGLVGLADVYLWLFGPDFAPAKTSLFILLVGQVTIVLAGADAILLVMLHRERMVMVVTTIGVAMNFVLNFILITAWGIEGAAIASLVSMAFVRIFLVVTILRTTRFNTTVSDRFARLIGGNG